MSEEVIYELNGVQIPHDDDILTPKVVSSIQRGIYERLEVQSAPKFLKPKDRILELGAGIGYISSYVAKVIGVEHVTCVEANPMLAKYISRMHEMQGITNTTVKNCVAVPGDTPIAPDEKADFYIREPFWSSSLDSDREAVSIAKVPQVLLSDLIRETRATAMIVDIEGGEKDIFIGGDLGTVRQIYVELHTRYIRPQGIKACFDALSAHGFYYVQAISNGGVVLFRR